MKLNLKALAKGYVVFTVNSRRYWSYEAARAACHLERGNVRFNGWNLWLWLSCNAFGPWRCFYVRYMGAPDARF